MCEKCFWIEYRGLAHAVVEAISQQDRAEGVNYEAVAREFEICEDLAFKLWADHVEMKRKESEIASKARYEKAEKAAQSALKKLTKMVEDQGELDPIQYSSIVSVIYEDIFALMNKIEQICLKNGRERSALINGFYIRQELLKFVENEENGVKSFACDFPKIEESRRSSKNDIELDVWRYSELNTEENREEDKDILSGEIRELDYKNVETKLIEMPAMRFNQRLRYKFN